MLTTTDLERRLVALGSHAHDGSARQAFASRLDSLLPQRSISTHQFALTKRKIVNPGGEPFDYEHARTPYLEGIHAALDHPDVRSVLAKGNTRCGKTVSFENYVLNQFTYGPLVNVLWLMQDDDSINDYIDERGEEMLRLHTEVNERIDWTDRRNSRKRKKIGKALLLYRTATIRALRAKSAPIIGADEIDAYNKRVRAAIRVLVRSRQEEYGSASKAWFGSHPDAGPDDGIDLLLRDSLLHLWCVRCPHCGGVSTPAKEAEDLGWPRLTWNVPEMMGLAEEMDRVAFLAHIADNVVLSCPHDGCHATFGPDDRLALMATGRWLQPHQKWNEAGSIEGEPRVSATMGFVIHAFMSPFVKLREVAGEWASAKLTFDDTGQDVTLREVTVKRLGETYQGAKAEEQIDSAKAVQTRLSSLYALKTVPPGVMFLTAFVDVQGDRFEVRVIGWDLGKQSWLIDAYAIKQWPAFDSHGAFDNIDPANRLSDWDVIEEAVLSSSYPLSSNPQRAEAGLPELFLPVARTVINSSGSPGVTNNARIWLANLLARGAGRIIPAYRVLLMQGSSRKDGELIYGRPKQVTMDDRNRPLLTPVYERYPIVHQIKRIIALRMKIEEPGPGRMHLPANLASRYFRELVSERMVDGAWVPVSRFNETWDGWVACEVARETLKPDRPGLWTGKSLPEWADPRPRGSGIETMIAKPDSIFDRLAALNDED